MISKQQNQAVTDDAVGVFMLGVPMSRIFGGGRQGQVAVAKGKVKAIDATLKCKGCRTPGSGA